MYNEKINTSQSTTAEHLGQWIEPDLASLKIKDAQGDYIKFAIRRLISYRTSEIGGLF